MASHVHLACWLVTSKALERAQGSWCWGVNPHCADTSICPENLLRQERVSPAVKGFEAMQIEKLKPSAFLCLESINPISNTSLKAEKAARPEKGSALVLC